MPKPGSSIRQVEEAVAKAEAPPLRSTPPLSTGSTLLNLACSGDWRGGFLPGKYHYLVGDSASGKTFLSMTCFAEALHNPAYKHYRLIYDNTEDGCLIDLARLFNAKVAARVRPPSVDADGEPVHSDTVEAFYYHLDDAIKRGKPFIYVLDSMDALESVASQAKFDANKVAYRKGKKGKGSYGDGKAGKNSTSLRRVLKGLRATGSILIIISQTRDNIGAFGRAEKKTRSGGHSLRFYATMEIWTSVAGPIKRTVRGKPRTIGNYIKIRVKKNRITGKLYSRVQTAIYPSFGIDDVGSCVDYLIDEKWWRISKKMVNAKELGIEAPRDLLIDAIEKKGLEDDLKAVVGKCWTKIDTACSLRRKNRYALGSS